MKMTFIYINKPQYCIMKDVIIEFNINPQQFTCSKFLGTLTRYGFKSLHYFLVKIFSHDYVALIVCLVYLREKSGCKS